MREKDLIYLVREPNGLLGVTKLKPPFVSINLNAKTWSDGTRGPYPLGGSISDPDEAQNVFGVYDRTKVSHLGAMAYALQMIERSPTTPSTDLHS